VNLAWRITGSAEDAAEVAQETFIRVLRSLSSYDPDRPFRTWLFTIARNLAADEARRASFRRVEPLDRPGPHGAAQAPADDPPPDRAADASLLRPKLEAALASLPPEQREVFLLREHAGLRFAEIAKVTGSPENTVKSRMRYALEGLREKLAELGVTAEDTARSALP